MSVIAGHSRLRAASAWWWGRCGRLQWLSSILPQSWWNLGHSGPHYTTPRYTHTLATHPHHLGYHLQPLPEENWKQFSKCPTYSGSWPSVFPLFFKLTFTVLLLHKRGFFNFTYRRHYIMNIFWRSVIIFALAVVGDKNSLQIAAFDTKHVNWQMMTITSQSSDHFRRFHLRKFRILTSCITFHLMLFSVWNYIRIVLTYHLSSRMKII